MKKKMVLRAIGYVNSSFRTREDAPRQGRESGMSAEIRILPEFASALHGLEAGRLIQATCWLHLASRDTLQVHPRGDETLPLTGVFATRSPARPNPLAVYVLDLVLVDGLRLQVRGLDAVDGTPVLDIRPHLHRLDD